MIFKNEGAKRHKDAAIDSEFELDVIGTCYFCEGFEPSGVVKKCTRIYEYATVYGRARCFISGPARIVA